MNNFTKNNELNKALKLTLNITDPNITVFSLSKELINGVEANVYNASLTFNKEFCPKCGALHTKFYIHNYKTSLIRLPKVSEFNTYLKLKKTRYKCLDCNKTFVPSTNLVNPSCFISNNTKKAIALKLTDTLTMKYIAKEVNVSEHSVMRILDSFETSLRKPTYKNYLPEVLHFDEFKSTKDARGSMSFIMMDGLNKKIIDIVESRQSWFLEKYFYYYTNKAKDNVKMIVIDMYTPYIKLIKKIFKNAIIIFDRFHIVQNLTRAFNNTRIQIMKKDTENYNKFKNYWKLFLKPQNDVSTKRNKSRHFKGQWISNKEVIEYMCNENEEFKINYQYYQKVLFSLKYRDKDKLTTIINNPENNISKQIKTCIQTYTKHKEYVKNGLEYEYNNGIIEGTISKIKKLKTISCGYKKFERFKTRIFITENLIKI